MSVALNEQLGRQWKKPSFITSDALRWTLFIGTAIYLIAAFASLEVSWSRFMRGWGAVGDLSLRLRTRILAHGHQIFKRV